jgi:hypothetical protein
VVYRVLAFFLPAALLVGPSLVPYLTLQGANRTEMPLEEAAFWSADLTDFLIPNPLQFVYGDWVQKNLTAFPQGLPYEFVLGWGWMPTLLAF